MRKLLAGATVVVFGAGAASSAWAQVLQMKGSDTLEDIAKGVIADCQNPAITGPLSLTTLPAGSIVYFGGGSGGGQAAMLANPPTQRIAPMSRPLNGAVACPGGSGTVQGILDPRAEELLIGLDGLAVVGANQTHVDSLQEVSPGACPDSILPGGSPVVLSFTTDCTADGCVAAGAGAWTYTFNSWKEVLAMIYGGQNNIIAQAQLLPAATFPKTRNPARINCASTVRKRLADSWGTIFEGAAGNCGKGPVAGNCTKLKHAFRRGDLSGTTDTFVTLTGMVAIPAFTTTSAANFPTVNPASATANPFCNAGVKAMNKGDSDYLDLDPIRRIADSENATNNRVGQEQVAEGWALPITTPPAVVNPPTVHGVDTRADPQAEPLPEVAEFGAPNRQNWGPDPNNATWQASQQAAYGNRKGLGLVLPIEIPTNYSDESTAYWAPAGGGAPVLCDQGQFAPSFPDTSPPGMCPDGTAGTACLLPVQCIPSVANCTSVNFNCLSDRALPAHPPARDERVFNLFVLNSAGKFVYDNYTNPNLTLTAVRQRRVVSAYFRLHTSQKTDFGGPTTVVGTPGVSICKQFTSTDQIGCLVKANPCSIGFAGREAVDKVAPFNTLAYQLGDSLAALRPPTPTNIYALLDSANPNFYPMSRKLFVNHWNDPALPTPASAANEELLYSCFKSAGITNARVSQFNFLPIIPGPQVDNVCPNNR